MTYKLIAYDKRKIVCIGSPEDLVKSASDAESLFCCAFDVGATSCSCIRKRVYFQFKMTIMSECDYN